MKSDVKFYVACFVPAKKKKKKGAELRAAGDGMRFAGMNRSKCAL